MELSTQHLTSTETDTTATERNIPVTVHVPTKDETKEIQTDADGNSKKQFECHFQEHICNLLKADELHSSNKEEKTPVVCIPRFILDGKIVIIFTDACQAVLKFWGSYSNLQHLMRKYGMERCRFSPLELRKLKSIGAVDMQVKQCSFIAEEDYRQLLIKYDENRNTDNAKFIEFSNPVDISDNSSTTNTVWCEKEHVVPTEERRPSPNISSSYRVQTHMIENEELIGLSELNSLFEMHFERSELLIRVLLDLEVVVHIFTAHKLERVDILTAATNGNFQGMCIKRKDFDRVLQYTAAFLDKNLPNVTWAHLGESNFSCAEKVVQGSNCVEGHVFSTAVESMRKPGNCTESVTMATSLSTRQSANVADAYRPNSPSGLGKKVVVDTDGCQDTSDVPHGMSQTESLLTPQGAGTSGNRYVIRTCRVNDEVVVCIPDLQKAVIDIYGQCVQVGSYMHRLNIPTKRFSRVLLKRLKAHNILSSRATLCTYITKTDSERLLQMYNMGAHCDSRDDILQNIEWSEPINLEDAVDNISRDNQRQLAEQNSQGTLKVSLFVVNDQIVVSMPDVHRAVQLLNGQSVQLQYNLEKLGIVKHKYSYNEVHQLKVLSHMKRPSLCTYITKSDVDKLLQFYVTPKNEAKMKLIEWQAPIAVESVASSTASDSICSTDAESVSTENNDDNTADSEMSDDYSISDLYKVFLGDDVECVHSSNEGDDLPKTLFKPSSSSSSFSVGNTKPVQCAATTSESRDKVDSPSDQVQANRANPPKNLLPPMYSHSRNDGGINQAASCVSQIKHVDNLVKSKVVQLKTCCPSNTVIVETHADLPNELSQVMATTGCSSRDVTSSYCNMHPSNVTGTSVVSTGSSVNSTVTSAGRTMHSPSADSINLTNFDHGHYSCKRPSEASMSDWTWMEQLAKKHRADHEDLRKTLQRKETEMKILHDAYQEQIKQEREHRLAVQRQLDQVKNSNAELWQNIERKELEMKILHDSYQLQMDLERKKREQLETEIINLRGTNVPQVKQEPL